MNKTDFKISRVVAVFLTCITFCFACSVQAAVPAPAPAAPKFDHLRTGFLLKDVHSTLKCEQCHVEGIFKNTPKVCSGCHAIGTRVGAKPKPINHVATKDECDTCHISTASFQVKSYNHLGVTGNCVSCHGGQYLGVMDQTMSGTRAHFPTTQPCESCHTNTSTFMSWRMNHAGLVSGCNTCHGGPSGSGLPSVTYPNVVSYPNNHVPLTSYGTPPPDCGGNCHNALSGSFYKGNWDHPGVVIGDNSCGTCHQGQYIGVTSIGSVSHMPQTAGNACDSCHKSLTSFGGADFNHTLTTAACSTCHSGQYTGVTPIDRTKHIPYPASNTCDTCHTSAITGLPSTTSKGLKFTGVTLHTNPQASALPPALPFGMACSTCHTGTFGIGLLDPVPPLGKGDNGHIPTTADCGTCHIASYISFSGPVFVHTGIAAGSCGTCHQGQYQKVVSINTAQHIPQTSGNACDVCHTNATTGLPSATKPVFPNVIFHKTSLGNPPVGTCTSCHNGAYLTEGIGGVGASSKNIGHVTTAAGVDCVACHTATNTSGYTTFKGASFSHTPGTYASFPTGTTANPKCSSCHNGTTALGKASTHVATTGDCLVCHTIASGTGCPNCVTFYGVQYDHSNGTTGVAAYTTFPTGTTATPRCDTCHGSTAYAKNAGHIPTTQDCILCHTPASTGCGPSGLCSTFLNAKFNHTGIAAGTCGTCHLGQYASVLSINTLVHIPQTSGNACDVCHTNAITGLPGSTTPTFLNAKFHSNFSGSGYTPAGVACTTCHSGTYVSQGAFAKNTGHVDTKGADCVSCHTVTNTVNFTTFLGAAFAHTPGTYTSFPSGAPASPRCDSCHNGTTAAKGMPTGHVATGGADCITCHLNSSTGCPNCSTFLGAGAAPHVAGATFTGKTCVSCHNGSGATGLSANPSHIPINGIDCGQCHPAYDGVGALNFGTTASATGTYSGVTKYTMNHTSLTNTCTFCHGGAYNTQGLYGALPKVSNHIPTTITGTQDCTICHTTLTMSAIKVVSGAADWKAEKMYHSNASGGGQVPAGASGPVYCVTCHLSGTTYMGTMSKKSHNGASTTKDCSSAGSCHRPTGKTGTAYSSW